MIPIKYGENLRIYPVVPNWVAHRRIIISQIRDPLDVLGLRLCKLYWVKYQSPQEYPYE